MKDSENTYNLLAGFQYPKAGDWLAQAQKDLKGEDPMIRLSWQSSENFKLRPYYGKVDIEEMQYLEEFQNRLQPQNHNTGEYRNWANYQKIKVKDEISANAEALEALGNGADGIEFDIEKNGKVDMEKLLDQILFDYCSISFSSQNDPLPFAIDYQDYIENRLKNKKNLSGYLCYPLDTADADTLKNIISLYSPYQNFHPISVKESSHTPVGLVAELSQTLSLSVHVLDVLTDCGVDPSEVLRAFSFQLSISPDYFGEVAKVRAVRILLHQITQAYEVKGVLPEDFPIHCLSPTWADEGYQPYGDLLKSTTAAMSAVVGGCNSLMIQPINDEALNKRMARNISNILKEESYFGKVVDPAAGSYYIEWLTDKLVKESWQLFLKQENEPS